MGMVGRRMGNVIELEEVESEEEDRHQVLVSLINAVYVVYQNL